MNDLIPYDMCNRVLEHPLTQSSRMDIMPDKSCCKTDEVSFYNMCKIPALAIRRSILLLLLAFLTTCIMACSSHKKEVTPQVAEKTMPVLNTKAINIMSVDEFAHLISLNEVHLIDVRTPQEYAQGHLIGAQNIDFLGKGFLNQIQQLDKSRPIAIYCRSGKRSNAAAQQLLHEGFTVADLQGGIMAWQKAGKDIATPPTPQKQ